MIRFHPTPGCASSCIANKERRLQVGTLAGIEVKLFEQLGPHASPRFPVLISCSSGKKDDGKVELTKDCARLGLEI